MILEKHKILDVQRVGDSDDGIEADIDEASLPFVFEMVSNKLYSNPIGSVIREITSNCFDSHIEAEVTDPVIIRKGYDSDEGFYIEFKDVGIGMSPERVRKTYMKYFSSTKRTTNKQIGGFGLGSKTPLAYTDMFYVTTIFDGIKYDYLLHKGETKPTLELLNEIETEEHNGTTIRVVMSRMDVYTFEKELKTQLTYFSDVWIEGFNINNDYDIYEGKYFKYRSDIDQSNTYIHIAIGKVRYPIDFMKVKVPEKFRRIPVAVKFDIGELKVTLSREVLTYDDAEVKLILERISLATEEVLELFEKENPEIEDLATFVKMVRDDSPKITFDLEKNHTMRIWANSGLSKNYKFKPIAHLPIKKNPSSFFFMWECIGHIQDGVYIAKKYGVSVVDNEEIVDGRYLIVKKDDRLSQYTNIYINEQYGNNVIVIRRRVLDFEKISEELDIKSDKKLGKAKMLIEYIRIINSLVRKPEKQYSFYRPTEEWINNYKRSIKESSAAWQRKMNQKVFVRSATTGFRGDEYKVADFQKRTGILIYGFREDRTLLEAIYNTVINYKKGWKGKEKRFMVIQISHSVEDAIIGDVNGPEKTIYCRDYVKTKFSREIETARYIYLQLLGLQIDTMTIRKELIKDFKEDHEAVKKIAFKGNYYMKEQYETKKYIPEMLVSLEKFKRHNYYIPLIKHFDTYNLFNDEQEVKHLISYLKFKSFRLRNEYYLKSKEQLAYEKGVLIILKSIEEPEKQQLRIEYKPIYVGGIDSYRIEEEVYQEGIQLLVPSTTSIYTDIDLGELPF